MLCIDMYLLKDFKAAKRWFLVETDAFRADSSQSRKAKMVSFLNMFMVTLPDFISFFLSAKENNSIKVSLYDFIVFSEYPAVIGR